MSKEQKGRALQPRRTRVAKTASRPAGRPAGTETTRANILGHAREAFGTHGFNGVSIRGIARSAGVNASTVIHFFGTKNGLFEAVVKDVVPLSTPLVAALERRATGEEIVRIYLAIWENDEAIDAMRAVVRTAIGSYEAMELLRETLLRGMLDALGWLNPLDAELAMMQLIGLGLGRYLSRLSKLTATDIDVIARRAGPSLDTLLFNTSPLTAGAPPTHQLPKQKPKRTKRQS